MPLLSLAEAGLKPEVTMVFSLIPPISPPLAVKPTPIDLVTYNATTKSTQVLARIVETLERANMMSPKRLVSDMDETASIKRAMLDNAPHVPVSAEMKTAAIVISLATGGDELGLLMNAVTDKGALKLYFSPVVAVQLLGGLHEANRLMSWWDKNIRLVPRTQK